MDRILARMKKSSGRMDPNRRGDKAPVRRLERRDAAKYINYDAASSSSSSAEDLSVSTYSLMTRSLELPDFRIVGGGEGEMDRIYRSLGVSGPEDLAISSAAWEACKKQRSSSDITNRFNSLKLDSHRDLSEVVPSGALAPKSPDRDYAELTRSELRGIGSFSTSADRVIVVDGVTAAENTRGIERTPTITVKSKGYLIPNDAVAVGGGIKGVRPPLLKPPPAMKRPPIDLQGSSWDFLAHFAPESETLERPSSSSSSSNNGCDEEEAGEEEPEKEETEVGDTADEAYSFTTNEGGSSSTVSNTSPIYSPGSIITSWQKGQLLGRGSFGSVYEGISG